MLTAKQIDAAKPRDKDYKLTDGDGLHLFVSRRGHRTWRWRYQKDGTERLMTLGEYAPGQSDHMTLRLARDRRDDLRREMREGKVPGAPAQAAAASSDTLEQVARRWHQRMGKPASVMVRLEADIFPTLGALPIRDIRPAQVLAALRAVEDRGSLEISKRERGMLDQVWGFAIGEEQADFNAAAHIRAAMKPKPPAVARPAVATIEEARRVLAATEALSAQPLTHLAMRFLALTAQRPGEIAGARWSEMLGVLDQWATPTWVIPKERMKMKREQAVALSRQAVEVLEAARSLSAGGDYVFPNWRSAGGMTEGTFRPHLYRAGMQNVMVPHGWRATFSTILNGLYPNDRLVIDLMLAHLGKGAIEGAYNRAQHMERRAELSQAWADMLLDGFKPAADLLITKRIMPIRSRRWNAVTEGVS